MLAKPTDRGEVDAWWADAGRDAPARRNGAAWLFAVVAAFAVFEVTSDPALSTAVGCLKIGWDEFRIAGYVRRRDPDRARGRVISRFYLAAAFWRITLVACGVTFGFVLICLVFAGWSEILGWGRPDLAFLDTPGTSFRGAITAAMGGFAVSLGITVHAIAASLIRRIPVWFGPEVRRAYHVGIWPPRTDPGQGAGHNSVGQFILGGSLAVASAPMILPLPLRAWRLIGPTIVPVILTMMATMIVFRLVPRYQESLVRIIAESPEVCWGVAPEVDHARA